MDSHRLLELKEELSNLINKSIDLIEENFDTDYGDVVDEIKLELTAALLDLDNLEDESLKIKN
jgi:hypothetical protein